MPLSLFLNCMKTQSTGQDPLKVNPTLHRRGGLWALFIVNLVCEAVAPAGREGRKEGGQLAGEAKRALTWARRGRRVASRHPEAARWLAPAVAFVGS